MVLKETLSDRAISIISSLFSNFRFLYSEDTQEGSISGFLPPGVFVVSSFQKSR
jgi:hypothetical protein